MSSFRLRVLLAGLVGAAALALAPSALAHVEVVPARVAPGSSHDFILSVANAEEGVGPIVGLDVGMSNGLVLGPVETKPGWSVRVRPRLIQWRGGLIPSGQFTTFAFRAFAQARARRVRLSPRLRYLSGSERVEEAVEIRVIAESPSRAPAARDEGARTLGKFALALALAAGVLGAAGAFGALALWLVGPRRPNDEERGAS